MTDNFYLIDRSAETLGGNRHKLVPQWLPQPNCNFMDFVQDVGAVVTIAADITNTDHHVFENHKTVLVFESFSFDKSRSHCSCAVLARISVHVVSKNQLRKQ